MRGLEEADENGLPGQRTALARYVFMATASLVALLLTTSIYVWDDRRPLYTPLIGAVAVAAWYGGVGPGLAAVAVCWGAALWIYVEPTGELTIGSGDEMVRWGIALGVALVVVLTSEVLRVGRRRATTEAATAQADLRRLESLNEVAAALAASVSTRDVVNALTVQGAELMGAEGATVGLVDGDELALEEPSGIAARLPLPSNRLPLRRETLLTRAVRDGVTARVDDRLQLVASYPDTAAMMPTVRAAIAIPLRAAGVVVGTLGFVFVREGALGDEGAAYATTMARLAEQALERARLYERERDTRRALDRILQVAPSFRADTAEGVAATICREARTTFGVDYSVLWRLRNGGLELIGIDPSHPGVEPGRRWSLGDFPELESAVGDLRVSFVADVLQETRDQGLDLVRSMGIRSSLRTPIVIGGRAELVLSLSWQVVVAEPDRSTLAIVRRFADQAALALEELERRRAELDASRRADEMRRLQRLTASLSNAITRSDVGEVVVEQVRGAVEADGAALAVVAEDRQLLRFLASSGYPEEEIERWREIPQDERGPAARALQRRMLVMYESRDAVHAEFPDVASLPSVHSSFLYVPLVAGRRVKGLLLVSFADPRRLTADQLAFVESLASQSAQALDRAAHFESEQTIAETLQRSVLPASLPRVEGLQLAARYLPGSAELDVGGDWFDAMSLPDGRIGLVVGDVVGKGVYAAASMGQLRNALRAFSVDRLKPSSVLARLNRLADEVLETTFATIAYVVVEPKTGICRIASAGHPPPLAWYPDGRVDLLEGGRGLPLGTGIDAKYRQDVVPLPAGATLLLYSDGLVERRGRSIDDGLARLCEAVRSGPSAPERMLEHVLEEMVGEGERGDDIALLAARLLPVAPVELDLRVSHGSGSLDLVRDALRAWLEGTSLDRADAESVVLAAWEACANASEHARDPTDDLVRVRASLHGDTVRVSVEDRGRWKPPTRSRERGLGLRLMRSLMSSVDIAVGDDGTRVTIEKSIAGAPRG